jgi:hypothetical protein
MSIVYQWYWGGEDGICGTIHEYDNNCHVYARCQWLVPGTFRL